MVRTVVLIALCLALAIGLVVAIAFLVKGNDDYRRAMDDAKRAAGQIRQTLDLALADGENWKRMAEENGSRADEMERRLRSIVEGFGEGAGIFSDLARQTDELIRTTGDFRRILRESGVNSQTP